MKRPKHLRHIVSFITLGAIALVLGGCGPDLATQSTSVAPATTQTVAPATTNSPPTTTALAQQTRVVIAEMFTSET